MTGFATCVIVVVCVLGGRVRADDEIVRAPVIERIEVSGMRRVDAEAIRGQLTSKVGRVFDPKVVRADIHAVWELR